MDLKIINNFQTYKTDFKTNTGKDWNEDLQLYIQYIQARSLDTQMQIITEWFNDSILHLSEIDGKLRSISANLKK